MTRVIRWRKQLEQLVHHLTIFVKSICLISQDNLIVAIVKGEDRVSIRRVAEALNIAKPRMATPHEILEKTGYPCGGTPPLGFEAVFLIDSQDLREGNSSRWWWSRDFLAQDSEWRIGSR